MAMLIDKTETDAQQQQAGHCARKQKWKEQPGNLHTAEELRRMSASFPPFSMHRRRVKTMVIE